METIEEQKNVKKKSPYCNNCGKSGHYYKDCYHPITSYGIITFKKVNNTCKFLMINRRNSICYVEFMRGKYIINLSDLSTTETYLRMLFSRMTKIEQENIKTKSFDELWDKLWITNLKYYENEKKKTKKKYEKLKDLGLVDKVLSTINTYYRECEWGFPKGRRNARENDLDCARREFREETGLKDTDYSLVPSIKPLCESYVGSNGSNYRSIYYVAESKADTDAFVDYNNKQQVGEIGDIKWFTLEECLDKIRDYYSERKRIIRKTKYLLGKFLLI